MRPVDPSPKGGGGGRHLELRGIHAFFSSCWWCREKAGRWGRWGGVGSKGRNDGHRKDEVRRGKEKRGRDGEREGSAGEKVKKLGK